MNYIDIFILIILGLAAVKGFSKGLIVELFSFVAFFFGIFVALEFAAPVSDAIAAGSSWYGLVLVAVFVLLFFWAVVSGQHVGEDYQKGHSTHLARLAG